MDPTKSKWFNPNRVNKSIDNKPVVLPSDKQPEKRNTKKKQIESGNESGNHCRISKGLYWINRHNISAVPILNVTREKDKIIIEVPNNLYWENQIIKYGTKKIWVTEKDIALSFEKALDVLKELMKEFNANR